MNGYDQKTIKKIILKIFDCCTDENCKHFKNIDPENIKFHHQGKNLLKRIFFLSLVSSNKNR